MSKIEQISRSVAQDRARLASSLDALSETVNPENIARDATTAANDHASILAQKAFGTLRGNRAGDLLVTIGLGLLSASSQRKSQTAQTQQVATDTGIKATNSAQESVKSQTRQTARKTRGFVQQQPLAFGALAFGFGILAGSLLPRTRSEDTLRGARRDALMSDPSNALEEDIQKAKPNVAQ